jgi:phosphoglycerate dehydrogenase-like enzyme
MGEQNANSEGGHHRVLRIGVSPDFYVDAKGKFEHVIEEQTRGQNQWECVSMPPLADKLATPEALDQFDAVFALALRVPRASLCGVKRLAVVARWGVGYDRIDVAALTEADIALAITPTAVRRPVAEAILTLILALMKRLPEQDRVVRGGGWRGDLPILGRTIPGHVLGVIGCGRIGRELCRLARPLGFEGILANDPYIRPEDVAPLGVTLVDRETLLRESDIVSLSVPLTDETRGFIGPREFAMMKPTAYFINTSRGPVVRHDALVAALRERRIAGAGIDVFPVEPPPKDDPLFALDNVIVTPHALGWTQDLFEANGREAFENLRVFARGDAPAGLVNPEVLERPGFQQKLERWANFAVV